VSTVGECFAAGDFGAIVTNTSPSGVWTPQQTSVAEASSPLGGVLQGVSCPSPGTCYAIGVWFYSSTNGGPWTLKNSTVAGVAISCPSATDCFVGSGGTILATTDGGVTWSQQYSEAPGNFITAISCPSTQVCVAAGTEGLFTTDGHTWKQLFNIIGLTNGVSCPSTSMCVGVGYTGQFTFTTNLGPAGGTWTSLGTPTTNTLNGVSCPVSDAFSTQCFAVGGTDGLSPATFLSARFSPASNSWSFELLAPPSPLGVGFSSVSCLPPISGSPVVCYAVTNGPQTTGVTGPSGNIVSYTTVANGFPVLNVEAAVAQDLLSVNCAGTTGSSTLNYECAAVGRLDTIVTKTVGSVGTGNLTPSHGSSEAGDPTTFTLDWTVPSPQVWRDLQYVDLKLVDDEGHVGLWARFIPGNPTSVFALLNAKGNIVSEGAPGTAGVLHSHTATLDLSKSSFQGTGPTGPSVTVNFVVSFKPAAAGNGESSSATRVYDVEISAADVSGLVQDPEKVGSWEVRAIHP
jgi:hypothetical protein